MASVWSKTFVVQVADPSEYTARASRRLIINADIVKAAKLCAGDIIALSNHDNVKDAKVICDTKQVFCL
jgi:AAA family ATPase